jgi:Tfp pilus assembly pilus retraction ATPase PilT
VNNAGIEVTQLIVDTDPEQIRAMLGESLRGVVAQQLMRKSDERFERGYKTFCVSSVLRDYRRTHGKQDEARNCIR